ncbi:MAG: hypothetical protein HQL73_13035, partial [Magnetococcales bacterium]|nr:hypothetical protein [Magnetococcales bacterium]
NYLVNVSETNLSWFALDDQCKVGDRSEIIGIPVSAMSGVYCGNDNKFVLGAYNGNVMWMRYTTDHMGFPTDIKVEHTEKTWSDQVRAMACGSDRKIYAGFRGTGIKSFKEKIYLEERKVSLKLAETMDHDEAISYRLNGGKKSGNEGTNKDDGCESQKDGVGDNGPNCVESDNNTQMSRKRTIPINTYYGSSILEINNSGEILLFNDSKMIWKNKISDTVTYRTGAHIDTIVDFLVDNENGRLFVLTSVGSFYLIDIDSGAIISKMGTSFYSAMPARSISFKPIERDRYGKIKFSYKDELPEAEAREVSIIIDE